MQDCKCIYNTDALWCLWRYRCVKISIRQWPWTLRASGRSSTVTTTSLRPATSNCWRSSASSSAPRNTRWPPRETEPRLASTRSAFLLTVGEMCRPHVRLIDSSGPRPRWLDATPHRPRPCPLWLGLGMWVVASSQCGRGLELSIKRTWGWHISTTPYFPPVNSAQLTAVGPDR